MQRLLFLAAVCSAGERIAVSFNIQPLGRSLNLSALQYVVGGPAGESIQSFAYLQDGILHGRASLSTEQPQKDYLLFMKMDPDRFDYWATEIYAKSEGSAPMAIETDEYILNLTSTAYIYKAVEAKRGPVDHRCVRMNCYYCLDVVIAQEKHKVCTLLSYNPSSAALNVNVGLNGHYFSFDNILSKSVQLRSPSICFDTGKNEDIAAACLKFNDMAFWKKVSGCMEMELELTKKTVASFPIDCFEMPI